MTAVSWTTARAKIAELVGGVTPSVEPGIPFVEVSNVPNAENAPPTRGYWLSCVAMSLNTRDYAPAHRVFRDVELAVFYRETVDHGRIDDMIGRDYEAIAEVLCNPDLYATATTGLEDLAQDGDEMLPADVELVPGVGRLLRIRLAAHHYRGET